MWGIPPVTPLWAWAMSPLPVVWSQISGCDCPLRCELLFLGRGSKAQNRESHGVAADSWPCPRIGAERDLRAFLPDSPRFLLRFGESLPARNVLGPWSHAGDYQEALEGTSFLERLLHVGSRAHTLHFYFPLCFSLQLALIGFTTD